MLLVAEPILKLVAGEGNAPPSTLAYETKRWLSQPAINLELVLWSGKPIPLRGNTLERE